MILWGEEGACPGPFDPYPHHKGAAGQLNQGCQASQFAAITIPMDSFMGKQSR